MSGPFVFRALGIVFIQSNLSFEHAQTRLSQRSFTSSFVREDDLKCLCDFSVASATGLGACPYLLIDSGSTAGTGFAPQVGSVTAGCFGACVALPCSHHVSNDSLTHAADEIRLTKH
ncbi:hypothetical protein PF011_g28045 [Phytophthora fragariae]|uniref:Uncharacterized protein n=1 Tax=Phytophthora fragariae TaxID=53985 RepID=A0A6A3HB27_9STRA|nr:hypothetical protein PF011_g28045 [Phytophthora fragariae]KAE9278542.1 hypothetical protein PF008_g28596 [Phytophthora fragariae]